MITLRAHQLEGAAWLASRRRAYLADAPRVGKTHTVLGALKLLPATGPALVICPAIVQTHWSRAAAEMGVDIRVASYDAIMRGGHELMKRMILDVGVTRLILDEAHYLGSIDAKRTIQILGRNGYARRMETVWALSGTPIPKRPSQMWATLSTLFPEVMLDRGMKTMDDFRNAFEIFLPRWARGMMRLKAIGTKNEKILREILATVMLRRTLADLGGDVPSLDWHVVTVDGEQTDIGCTVDLASMMADRTSDGTLEGIANDPQVARMRRRLGELKAEPVAAMIGDELRADPHKKLVVFAHHRDVLHTLRDALEEFLPAYIDGTTDLYDRDRMITSFQNQPECRVFVGQNIACCTGIRLDAADTIIMVEPDWTAVVNEQLGNRVIDPERPERKCVVQMIALGGTLDEGIVRQNRRETLMVAEILQ